MTKLLASGDFQFRLNIYKIAIKKMLARKKQVIILVPDLEMVPYFTRYLSGQISIIHSGLTRTKRYIEWQNIRAGKSQIVIGSNSALFSPAKNLGLIIVDQEESETYKNNQSPRYHAVEVSKKLCKLSNAKLILGSLTPRLTTYQDALKGNFKIFKKNQQRQKSISIIDMNFEKEILSRPLQDQVENALNRKRKVLLVLNRKGEGTKFSCKDCGWILTCEKCGLPLIPQQTDAVCYNCEKHFPIPTKCSKCQSIHLKPFGIGIKKLHKLVQDLWPKAKTLIIDKENDNFNKDFDVVIATSFLLKFSLPKIGFVGIINADQSLNFPDFHSAEQTFQILFKFLKIGEWGIIQTHLPENSIFSSLAKLDYNKFFLAELQNRKKNQFPPYTFLTRLLYQNTNEEICIKETERVKKQLATNNSQLIILGPNPCFVKKERNKFRYQIIIKSKSPIFNFSFLKTTVRSLPKGWVVDIDPVNLL